MNDSTRRGFLGVVGAGAVAAGAAAALSSRPAAATSAESSAQLPEAPALPAGATGSLVAYVHDVSSGEVTVMVEGHEVAFTDHQLVARLAQDIDASRV